MGGQRSSINSKSLGKLSKKKRGQTGPKMNLGGEKKGRKD